MSPVPHPGIYHRATCRACRGALVEFLNLGDLKLNAFPASTWELDQIHAVPLILTHCTDCGLVQLDRTVPPDWLYREYWYRSSINETMVAELHDVVQAALRRTEGSSASVAMDIGANDGTLLQQYDPATCPLRLVGVEPALNLQNFLAAYADRVVPEYFPHARTLDDYRGQCRIVSAIAMCYDLEDPLAFFDGLKTLLAPDGIAVVQFQDFAQQLQASAFDNICHEHLEYYTLWSLSHLTARAGLRFEAVEHRAINGGSLRVWLRHNTFTHRGLGLPDPSIAYQLSHELTLGLDTPSLRAGRHHAYHRFADKVKSAKTQIAAVLDVARAGGQTIDIYGASTKGNILLQILGVGPAAARQAIDRDPRKVGRLTLTGIPIVSEDTAKEDPAALWLAPIWQFKESVLRREAWYLEQGGTIVFPLPHVEVVRNSWMLREKP